MNAKLFAYLLMDLGWKALLVLMIIEWANPFAGQSLMLGTVVMSGIVQLAYLLSYKEPASKPVAKPKSAPAPKKAPTEEVK